MSALRIRVISVALLAVALVFGAKLYLLQVVKGSDYRQIGDKQYKKPQGGIFNRGSIYFKSKEGELISAATVKSGFIVTINPREIDDAEAAYNVLSEYLTLDKETFLKQANKDDPYEEIARRVDASVVKLIEAKKIKGVGIYREQWRFYPGNDTAAHLLGFLAYKDDELGGRYGIERSYEKVLSRNGSGLYSNFFIEIFSNIRKTFAKDESFEGDVVTSIEPTVQAQLEAALRQIQGSYASEETAGIIMDPKTGSIIAMAAYPTFDNNNFQKEESSRVFSNPIVEKVIEMGSIIKPITVASGIDAGVITPKSSYYDKGFVTYNNKNIYNFDREGRGQVDMQIVLNKSLNTGAAFVVDKLGSNRFADYMHKFGLGEKTEIDLPNEAANIVSNLKSPREIEYITASFGQGIALTPISTIRALGALANGGAIVRPHVVEQINYRTGIKKPIEPEKPKQAIKKETADQITSMLVEVVDGALLGGKFKNPHYAVATKTGTAQIPNPEGGYYDDRYLHSFFGYFPAYNPRFVILLYTSQPKTNLFAADTLAPGFFGLANFLISYYDLPPDR